MIFLLSRDESFSANELPTSDSHTDLVYLIYKDGARPVEENLETLMAGMTKFGASVDPWDLPKGMIEAV